MPLRELIGSRTLQPPTTVRGHVMPDTASILSHYDIGQVVEIHEINSGLMHSTYAVDAGVGRFTLQRLHKVGHSGDHWRLRSSHHLSQPEKYAESAFGPYG